MQIKTTRYHFIPIRLSKIKEKDHTKCWGGYGIIRTLIHGWWEYKNTTTLEKHLRVSYKVEHIFPLLPNNSRTTNPPKRKESAHRQKCMYEHVYSSIIHNDSKCPSRREWVCNGIGCRCTQWQEWISPKLCCVQEIIHERTYHMVPFIWASRIDKTNLWWKKENKTSHSLPLAAGAWLGKDTRELSEWWKCSLPWIRVLVTWLHAFAKTQIPHFWSGRFTVYTFYL